MRLRVASGLIAFLAASCLGDAVGPGGSLIVSRLGAGAGGPIIGTPGRPVSERVLFQVTDEEGRPVPGAAVQWVVVGSGAQSVDTDVQTDAEGRFGATWVLGVRAEETQQLAALVRVGDHRAADTLDAVAVPAEVSSISFAADTTVVRLGVPRFVTFEAVDPFGNHFVPLDARVTSLDTVIVDADSTGRLLARGRGHARIVVGAGAHADTAVVAAIQVVQAIEVGAASVGFRSLGEETTLALVLRDDQGLPVLDSLPRVEALDTSIVELSVNDSLRFRSRANGATTVLLTVGSVVHQVGVTVRQRVFRLRLQPDSIQFDAIGDTVRIAVETADSLGYPIPDADLTFETSTTSVVQVDTSGLVTSVGNGASRVSVSDSLSAVSVSSTVIVEQVATTVGIDVSERDGFSFAAQGDSIGGVWARDRNGYLVPVAALSVSIGDSTRVLATDGALRAARSGPTTVSVDVDGLHAQVAITPVVAVEVLEGSISGFTISGMPDSISVGPPTAISMPNGDTRLYFTGYAPDPTQYPPFSGDLHYAVSPDGVQFAYAGVALRRDAVYRSQGIENVAMVPRDDGPGCRLFAAAGASWWIWQVFSAVADDCTSWVWEPGPTVPGEVNSDFDRRGIGEGMYTWQDSSGIWWMLVGAHSLEPEDDRVWTVGLYRGTSQRQWAFVRTIFRPGPAGSGRDRAVFAPSVVEFAPGLYRMFFAGDDYGIGPSGGSSRIWSAVSRDRFSWTFEGLVLGPQVAGEGPSYPTVIGDRLYYQYRNPFFGGVFISAAHINQP